MGSPSSKVQSTKYNVQVQVQSQPFVFDFNENFQVNRLEKKKLNILQEHFKHFFLI